MLDDNFTLRLRCPFCFHIERMKVLPEALKCWAEGKNDFGSTKRMIVSDPSQATIAATCAICPNCSSPFGLEISSKIRSYSGPKVSSFLKKRGSDEIDQALNSFNVVLSPKVLREAHGIVRDESLPEIIREQFIFIQEDAKKKRNPAGILSGARSCLDVALKSLGEEEGGRRDRINNLANKGIITKDIAAWAQKLWKDGSDATHDLKADIVIRDYPRIGLIDAYQL